MASVKKLILSHLATQLEDISVANSYNTDIAKVIEGRILPTEKLRPDWKSACCQIRYDGQANERDNQLADSHGMSALARYICFVSMDNATDDEFLMFLDDVEASVSKDPTCGDLDDDAYNVMDVWVDRIDVIDTEEYDEIMDTSSQDIKNAEASMLIFVEYFYIADLLSGV